jgi:hypothetical protein
LPGHRRRHRHRRDHHSDDQTFTVSASSVIDSIASFLFNTPISSCTTNFGDLEGTALVFEPGRKSHLLMLSDLAGSELAKYLGTYNFPSPL